MPGERASDREALVTEARRRKSGGRAAKADGLTRGDLALRLKGRRESQDQRSEKSAEAIVAGYAAKGRTMGRELCSRSSVRGCHRSRAQTSSAPPVRAVKPRRLPGVWASHRTETNTGARALASTRRTARCGPACRVVWEGRSRETPPYPDLHGRKSETSDLRWSSPRVTLRGGQALD